MSQYYLPLPTIDKIVLRPGTVITEYTSTILLPIAQLEMGIETEFYLSRGPSLRRVF
jgi:hypothetical protein